MPRFHLNLYNNVVSLDGEGVVLPDLEAARDAAIMNIRDIMKDELVNGQITLGHRIEIVNDRGRILATVFFRDAVTVND
jgi:hypothetical protein